MTRDLPNLAAVDCGTNTIKLLVISPDGAPLLRTAHVVRLGEDVDSTGRLSAAALARTFAAVEEYAGLVAAHDVGRVRFCATSATRDAANAEEFATGVAQRLGVRPEVLDGEDEARLAFAGAVSHLAQAPAGDLLVVDVGGGSTELILGRAGQPGQGNHPGQASQAGPSAACSMDIGSVRLHERHLHSDPPTPEEVRRVVHDVETALDGCPIDLGAVRSVVGVAGTVTTVAAGVLGLTGYDREAIDQQVLAVGDVQAHVERLVAMTLAERRDLPWMHPGRADVIGAGALILSRVLARCAATELVVSESDILDGIAASLLA